ncbi:hypothetical protein C8R45DRAFT_946724 [Mycena sanguinolenta]|nr:hypothetical protein C8R45DRAFT_946724 [Mycena sanguinolenta]
MEKWWARRADNERSTAQRGFTRCGDGQRRCGVGGLRTNTIQGGVAADDAGRSRGSGKYTGCANSTKASNGDANDAAKNAGRRYGCAMDDAETQQAGAGGTAHAHSTASERHGQEWMGAVQEKQTQRSKQVKMIRVIQAGSAYDVGVYEQATRAVIRMPESIVPNSRNGDFVLVRATRCQTGSAGVVDAARSRGPAARRMQGYAVKMPQTRRSGGCGGAIEFELSTLASKTSFGGFLKEEKVRIEARRVFGSIPKHQPAEASCK